MSASAAGPGSVTRPPAQCQASRPDGLEQVGARPRPGRIEVGAVAGGDAEQHGVRLALTDRVRSLVPAHDAAARQLVARQEVQRGTEGLVGRPRRHAARRRAVGRAAPRCAVVGRGTARGADAQCERTGEDGHHGDGHGDGDSDAGAGDAGTSGPSPGRRRRRCHRSCCFTPPGRAQRVDDATFRRVGLAGDGHLEDHRLVLAPFTGLGRRRRVRLPRGIRLTPALLRMLRVLR